MNISQSKGPINPTTEHVNSTLFSFAIADMPCKRLIITLMLVMSFLPSGIERVYAGPGERPNWVVDTYDGKRLSLYHELKQGHKVVVVFWATWCRFCRELLPELDKIYQSGEHNKVTFVAMNIWEDSNPIDYMAGKGLQLPLVLRAESIARKYGIRGTPGVLVIGEGHEILYQRRAGHSTEQTVQGVVQALAGR